MRIPQQVTERVKEAPAQALRAVFSGIGQVLLVADRMKHRAAEPDRARSGVTAPAVQPRPGAPVVRDETRWRSLDTTGNVRLLNEEDTATAERDLAAAAAATEPAAAAETFEPEREDPELAVMAQSSLPVPNYDDLTIASLRARLRGLDRSQVQLLHDYEKANAGRAEVLTMFERRIVKLDSGA
jgi:hypothetical protein